MAVYEETKPTIPERPVAVPTRGESKALLVALLDQAMTDPAWRRALLADPLGTTYAAGVRLTAADLKHLLGLPGATDLELLEVLRVRLAQRAALNCGCGHGDDSGGSRD
jgi:hypothetical protein